MEKESYKILIIGPTGAGKSQFCIFFKKRFQIQRTK